MQVFIDTNILLSFYHLTSEDLEQLEKLALPIENEEIRLDLPEQVIDETWRNRANKIKGGFQTFKQHKFAPAYPAYCRDYENYEKMRKAEDHLQKQHASLIEQIQKDIDNENLGADHLLRRLFKAARVIKLSNETLHRALRRVELGNPPGKAGSLGDAITRPGFTKRRPTMHTQREPTSFTPEATLKSQQRLTPRSTARNSIVAAGI